MKKILILLVVLMASVIGYAQDLRGIRVESQTPVIIYVNGQRMSPLTQTFFLTGINRGYYTIEAFVIIHSNIGCNREECIYSTRVSYTGRGVVSVFVSNNGCGADHNRPHVTPPCERYVMSEREFNDYIFRIKRESFTRDKMKEVERAIVGNNTYFTAQQIVKVMKCFSFDSDRLNIAKMLYPFIVNPRNTGIIVDAFDFSTSKRDFDRFVDRFNESNRH